MKFTIKIIFFSFLFLNTPLFSTILNTKHNLSVAGTGTVKAQTETGVCVFCHVPHSTQPEGKPLWNRSMPASAYTMYDSDYLRRMSYPAVQSDLGTVNNTPGALSRQCLSCHDGTVAIGAVHVLHSLANQTIAMNGVDLATGTMLSTAAGFIGTDLTKHHPVGIEYDSTITMSFGSGSKTIELKAIPDSPIKLFTYGGKKYVECSSCHNPHKENDKFLHVDTGINLAQNISTTCTSCHQKVSWSGSIHQTPPVDALYTDANTIARYGTNKMSDLGCANCHTPHNGEGIPYLTRKTLANTCFVGAAGGSTTASCHGVGGYKDIESVLSKLNAHPVIADSNPANPKHTNLDTLYGTGTVDPNGGLGIDWANNKHAVCMDCHNQHKAQAGTHVTDGSWYGPAGTLTNNVSPAIQGVAGVEPSWPGEWTQPTTFTTLESSTKEYQICLKCHSYWGVGTTKTLTDPTTNYPSVSDFNINMTDIAWEMNINNKSGHPVVIGQSSRVGSYDTSSTDGSTGLRKLDPLQLTAPWNTNVGVNTMYCSDCHGADDEPGTDNIFGGDPKGPHGSNLKFLLKGKAKYWPTKPGSTILYDTNDIGVGDADLFCTNCHDLNEPHKNQWNGWMTGRNINCVECHVAIPHGSPISRLIGYRSFPAPYNYNGNSLAIKAFRKNALTSISKGDLQACGGGMCHGWGISGADANLMP